MESIDIKALESFVLQNTEVAILDHQGEDQAPFVKKKILNSGLCPDGTHLRIYFDDRYFFAVPLTAKVKIDDNEWSAFDEASGLYYVIRKESGIYA